jgi:hypothetical protein
MVAFIGRFLAILPLLLATTAQDCPGICLYWGDKVLNADYEVTINEVTGTCAFFHKKNMGHNDTDRCLGDAEDALDAGCICGVPTVCPGICLGPEEIMLNAGEDVSVDRTMSSCDFLDSKAKDIISDRLCKEMAEKADDAGCICGLPTSCPGACLVKGESMLNAATQVNLDGEVATCSFLDLESKKLIGDEICANMAKKVEDAGCKCGVPIKCPGVCLQDGDSLLNPHLDVVVDGQTEKCEFFESLAQEVIDGDICTEMAEKAAKAGCRCGVPMECPGICLGKGESVLNSESDVAVGGLGGTCDFFDLQAKEVIDGGLCDKMAADVAEAGCRCGVPIECPGICSNGMLPLNPDEQKILDHVGSSCSYFNDVAKQFIDPVGCSEYGQKARDAGCLCPAGGNGDEEGDHGHVDGSAGYQRSLLAAFALVAGTMVGW